MRTSAYLRSVMATALASGSPAMPALAQEAALATGLEEVVVSARRRDESLQDVPVAVSAFSGDQIERQNIQDFYEIVDRVPGFVINTDNITEPNMFMRGIGTDIEASAANPSVAVFIDDVYISRAGGTLGELWDLERVEVLRGPQSTLFGKNVVGGLVHFVTRKPDQEFNARVEASAGDYSLIGVRGSISGPLTDTVSASLAAAYRERDGYATNTLNGEDMEDVEASGVRGHLRVAPNEDLDVLLSADYTRRRGAGRYIDISYSPRNAAFINPDRRRGPISGPPAGGSGSGRADVDDGGVSLRVEWQTGAAELTSITAFRDSEVVGEENSAGTFFDWPNVIPFVTPYEDVPDDFFFQTKTDEAEQFSQEFRLTSTGDGPWSWITGVYYLKEKIDREEFADYLFPDIFWSSGQETVVGKTDGDSYGIFGEATYTWESGLALTAGVRYSRDEKTYDYAHTGAPVSGDYRPPFTIPEGFTAQASDSWDAWTPNVVLSYKPADNQLYYAKIARGYKSGGFAAESDALSPDEATIPFDPEFALNYELGAKLDLLDNRLRLNPVLFWTDYTDLQTQQLVIVNPNTPPDNVIVNAGEARARGLELEIVGVPLEGWQLFGSYAYLDCEFTADLIVNGENQKGNTCRRSPENSFNVGTSVEFPLSSLGLAHLELGYTWQDSIFFDNDNNPLSEIDSQSSLDASVGLTADDERWQLTVWGKNLTDELNVSGRALLSLPDFRTFEFAGFNDTILDSYLPPRTYGVTFRWNFE